MAKVLIIKLGYSETLDGEISTTTSLGDVLRTTVLLHFLKSDQVTWLVDKRALPLLEGTTHIERLLVYNLESVLQLQKERFDTVINLEKVPGICALADSINAWRRFGFRFDEANGVAQSYDGAEKVLALSLDVDQKKGNRKFWQEALTQMIGEKWDGERYILGYQPKTEVLFDIGFNWATGTKWRNKGWPDDNWSRLEKILECKYTISWQEGLDSLCAYMEWVHSCKLIVTNDSLGMHLGLAMGRKVVAMFGPSSSNEVCLYGSGVALVPDVAYNCIPCLRRECSQPVNCMKFITPETVAQNVEQLLPL